MHIYKILNMFCQTLPSSVKLEKHEQIYKAEFTLVKKNQATRVCFDSFLMLNC